jgi:hypothetical protein
MEVKPICIHNISAIYVCTKDSACVRNRGFVLRVPLKIHFGGQRIFLSLAASGKSRFIIQVKHICLPCREQKSSVCRSKAIFRATLESLFDLMGLSISISLQF